MLINLNSIILPIKVNKKITIGASSVVSKNCKKNNVFAGNPAKILNK
jgi:serine acetyltransferase